MIGLAAALALALSAQAPAPPSPDGGAPSPLASPEAKAPRPLAAFTRRYLDGLFRAKPHLATYMGDHRFDSELAPASEAALRARAKDLEDQGKELKVLSGGTLSRDERVDAAILADGIALEHLELTDIREHTWSPRLVDSFTYYDPRETVAARLSDMIHGTYAPEGERRSAVAAQLRLLPAWLAERKRSLSGPVSKVHLDQAVKDNRGRIAFFGSELAAFTKGDAPAEAARVAAVEALQGYQSFMERELPARATAPWRLGRERYGKKFPLALQTDLAPEGLTRLAREDFAAARQELFETARRLHRALWPREPQPADALPAAEQGRVIARVRDALAEDHPTRDGLVRASAEKLEGLRAFVEAKGLVTLPPRETLSVEAMPEFKRGGAGAEYLSPGGLEPASAFHGTYFVEPVDPSWPAGKVESYLRSNNSYEIALTAAHEALPGHHTQAWWARRDPSALRATLWSGPFAEGWAVYGTSLLVRLGYGGAENDRYRFLDLQGRMIVAANAVLDAGLQGGAMTDEEALRFMVEDGFQGRAQAEKKLLRAKLDSTQLCQYFLGSTELLRLERDARAKGAFDQRRFDEALLSHGTIAVKHLRALLLGG